MELWVIFFLWSLFCSWLTFVKLHLAFIEGMIVFVKNNHTASVEEEAHYLERCLAEELVELAQERKYSFAWFKELSDVHYLYARQRILAKQGLAQYESSATWSPLFYRYPLTTFKLAYRYMHTGCMRSAAHHGKQRDHVCSR